MQAHLCTLYLNSMASSLLRSTLSFVVTDYTFTGVSETSKLALQQTEELIKKTSKDVCVNDFDEFAVDLVVASSPGPLRGGERAWYTLFAHTWFP